MNSLNGYSWKRITSNQSRLEEFSDTREVCIKDFEAERSKKKNSYQKKKKPLTEEYAEME